MIEKKILFITDSNKGEAILNCTVYTLISIPTAERGGRVEWGPYPPPSRTGEHAGATSVDPVDCPSRPSQLAKSAT
jgi:hypothetical protein